MMLRQDMKQQDLVPDDVSVEDLNRLRGKNFIGGVSQTHQ